MTIEVGCKIDPASKDYFYFPVKFEAGAILNEENLRNFWENRWTRFPNCKRFYLRCLNSTASEIKEFGETCIIKKYSENVIISLNDNCNFAHLKRIIYYELLP